MGCVCVFICKKLSYAIGRNVVTKKKNNLFEWKAPVDTVWIKGTDLKDKFLL